MIYTTLALKIWRLRTNCRHGRQTEIEADLYHTG